MPTYEKRGEKLIVAEVAETEFSYDQLVTQKDNYIAIIARTREGMERDIAAYEAEVTRIQALLDKAEELGVESESAKLQATHDAAVAAAAEK